MSRDQLKTQIEARFQSKRAFVLAFNEKVKFEAIDETTLSRQLSGRVKLSHGWQAAYILFFQLCSE